MLRSVCWFPAQRQGPVPATSQRLDHTNHRHSHHVKHKEGCTFPSVGPLTSCRHRGSNERISNPWPPFISNQICSLFSWKESQAGHQEDPPSLSVKASCQEGHPFCRCLSGTGIQICRSGPYGAHQDRAHAGPTLCRAQHSYRGCEMTQIWHLPHRRSQCRGERHRVTPSPTLTAPRALVHSPS